eukprot:TRINITY_DN8207_c0_g1_i1.p1 TRINITY_DN8207_c0_g1~~TRINITY_DN8207_c0_g1_i1.p1  ORF type:complete len:144 (+),score=30.87 TRINITY_DN8207_c0_g1_i1:168-599(+)
MSFLFIFLIGEILLPSIQGASLRWITQREGGQTSNNMITDYYNQQFNKVSPETAIFPSSSDLPPWSSYPPPVPLWAIHKPRRQFRPFFGIFSIPMRPSSPPPPTSAVFQSDCQPDGSTGNLPLACIAIIEALRDNDVDGEDSV